MVDDAGAYLYTEILRYVKIGKFSIDIGIDNRDEIYTDKAEDAEVALSAVVILTILEYTFEVILVSLDVVAGWKEILIASGTGIVIHDVEVGL